MSSEYSKKRTVINIDSHVVSMCKENLDYSTCVMIIYITMPYDIIMNFTQLCFNDLAI